MPLPSFPISSLSDKDRQDFYNAQSQPIKADFDFIKSHYTSFLRKHYRVEKAPTEKSFDRIDDFSYPKIIEKRLGSLIPSMIKESPAAATAGLLLYRRFDCL